MFDLEVRPETAHPAPSDPAGAPEGESGSEERHVVPADLSSWEPGPVLGAILSVIDIDRLSGHDKVVVLEAYQRMASHYEAGIYRTMASIWDTYEQMHDDLEWVDELAAAEVRAALKLTRRAASNALGMANDLFGRFPQIGHALTEGQIDRRRAYVLVDQVIHLPERAAHAVIDQIIDQAAELTTGQLRARLRKLAFEVEPEEATERYRSAVEERKVVMDPTPDGTANLCGFDLPPDRASAAADRINRIARRLNTRDDPRSIDQIRADVFLDLLCGVGDSAPTGVLNLTVDLETLTRLADHPGELDGYGPVIADLARRAARAADTWRYTITDPRTGEIVDTGSTRRRPTDRQRRRLQDRYPTCVFPTCRMPARDCDLDHRLPHAQHGPTTDDNLAPLCRHDHCIRHRAGWTYVRNPDGSHQWTSPLGHTYTTGRSP